MSGKNWCEWKESAFRPTGELNIYDLIIDAWHLGAPMPAPLWFSNAYTVGPGTVIVADGRDATKKKLSSALAYATAANKWVKLPDMSWPRDQ